MNRVICDVKHPMIKDADELWVFCHKENKFRIVNRNEYPKPKGSICQICPNGVRKTSDLVIRCQTKVETWSTFKSHLVTIEKIYGELVAFPTDIEEAKLPAIENYKPKHRAYGQLIDYQENESFYLYDVRQAKFITVQRNMLSKLYTKAGLCSYCPCIRKIQSPSSIIQHLQSIENRFYCFLVLDNDEQNDKRNQEKITNFVNSVKENQLNEELQDDAKSPEFRTQSKCDVDESEDERSRSSEYLSITEDAERNGHHADTEIDYRDENSISVLNQMEKCFKKENRKLETYFNKLKGKVNVCSLDQSIVNSQEQMTLTKRTEDFQSKEKHLSFTKKLDLETEDLDYLIKKFDIPKSYRIKNVEVNLNLKMKPKSKQQLNLNGSINSSSRLSASINDEIRIQQQIYTPNGNSLSFKIKQEDDLEDE